MSWTEKNISFRSLGLRAAIISFAIFGLLFVSGAQTANAQAIAEGFENVPALFTSGGWFQTNKSQPLGASTWSQCSGTSIPPAQAGTTNSCILVNFNSTTGTGTISNWLIAPTIATLNNGDTFSFYTKTVSNAFPDRLQVRLSTSGASTDVGTTATSVGVFTTLLLDIDPTYQGTYPTTWTQFTVTVSGLSGPTSGRLAFRYFVEDGGPSGANSNIIGIDSFVYTPGTVLAPGDAPVDFNGDGKTDFSVVRNTGGGTGGQVTWFNLINGTTTVQNVPFGLSTDFFVPADYDGDGKDDIAVFRPGTGQGTTAFYILQSATSTIKADQFGIPGDDPTVVGDYDGDGKDDVAVYRAGATAGAQSFFFYRASTGANSGQVIYNQWGQNGDFPAPGDYDGDGKNDFVVQRAASGGQAVFYMRLTTSGQSSVIFGTPTDLIVPGDYDGDGKTDIAVVRNSGGAKNWYVRPSSAPTTITYYTFGLAGDLTTQGDYDGDGKTDVAVWRPSADPAMNYFYYRKSTNGSLGSVEWGQQGDYPVANYNSH